MQVSSLASPELMAKIRLILWLPRPSRASSCAAPPAPALRQHTACLRLGQVGKEKLLEGTREDGGCSQNRVKGPRKLLADFGSPIDALHGLLLNICLPFLLHPFLCKVLCFSTWKNSGIKELSPLPWVEDTSDSKVYNKSYYCLEEEKDILP